MALRASSRVLDELHAGLLRHSPCEAAAFLAAEPSGDGLVLRGVRTFTEDEMTDKCGELTLDEDVQARELARIKRAGHALVEVHTHPGTHGAVGFSALDNTELESFARYVSHKLPGRPFGALVLGPAGYAGRVWTNDHVQELTLAPIGERMTAPGWIAGARIPGAGRRDRFDRQLRALGTDGQARLAALRVGVVGVGGTGSVVVQQLAHLGINSFVLVDDDHVERSNLPRLAGATRRDALFRRRKTAVARRLVRRVASRGPEILVTGDLRTHASLGALREVDLIVGCVDNDGARLVMTELAAAHLIPYLDIGVGIETGPDGVSRSAGGSDSSFLVDPACAAPTRSTRRKLPRISPRTLCASSALLRGTPATDVSSKHSCH